MSWISSFANFALGAAAAFNTNTAQPTQRNMTVPSTNSIASLVSQDHLILGQNSNIGTGHDASSRNQNNGGSPPWLWLFVPLGIGLAASTLGKGSNKKVTNLNGFEMPTHVANSVNRLGFNRRQDIITVMNSYDYPQPADHAAAVKQVIADKARLDPDTFTVIKVVK